MSLGRIIKGSYRSRRREFKPKSEKYVRDSANGHHWTAEPLIKIIPKPGPGFINPEKEIEILSSFSGHMDASFA